MAEKSYFYDSTTDDQRIYQAADFARFHAQIIGNGVSNTNTLPDLEVTARDNMNVALGVGYMFANGYMYENDSALTLKHDIADSINDRIDRVVIQFNNDPAERRVFAYIKKGIPSSNPVPPIVERTVYIHEMSAAQVRVIAGKSYIEQPEITDERTDDNVCGYIPLHNIYRGMQINEIGMVTMPNQSYVEMIDDVSLTIKGSSEAGYQITKIPINPNIDRQSEVESNAFYAKADGVYQFNFTIAMVESVGTSTKLQSFVRINEGDDEASKNIFLFNRPGIGSSDAYFHGIGMQYLKKGDKAEIDVSSLRLGGDKVSRYRRLSIVKLN